MSFPVYPQMVDSGVEWLGQVPKQWTVLPIKRLSPVLRGASPRPIEDPKYFDDEGEYAWVRIADVSASNGVLTETTQQLSELGASLSVKLAPGSLFVSIAGTVGKPCILGLNACIHDGFVHFPRLRLPSKFLYRIFEAGECYKGLGKWGTQLNLNTDTIGSIPVAIPPADELEAILLFLDRETSKIDTLIDEQKRLIELLKEKRQAVISHAVTKGLNPHAPMKDSGIKWLGMVPAHWEVKRLRHVTMCCDGQRVPLNSEQRSTMQGTIPYWGANAIMDYVEKSLFDEDLVLLGEDGAPFFDKTKPVAFFSSGPVWPNNHIHVLRPVGMNGHYLAHILNVTDYAEFIDGSTRDKLTQGRMNDIPVLVPPADEQAGIVSMLREGTTYIEDLLITSAAAISLLQERRSALISAAVTGKIDVRSLVEKNRRTEVEAA